MDFPSFSEGLSLRVFAIIGLILRRTDFPSFSEGLSLRDGGVFGCGVRH